ncbi:hypothetical protein [Litoribacter populi]|uniref:hypothetical protein n=1 Tax=Litoribacter populi TaxID=2598460 RepID=UPI00117C0210|nr:hypothetical protein [Litoribacter populi]
MKLIVVLFSLIFSYKSTNEPFHEVRIDSNTTKEELEEKIKNAEKLGLLIDLPYATYLESGKVSVLQIKAEVKEVGNASSTYDFNSEYTCVVVFKDLRINSKSAFGFKECE